ncbi:ribosome-inactivating family protein [Streptomyces sp. NPDC051677]|uniref:ribosome-inactivating family protein n=1 Tax=Streptomyces sp. NPDC051677 TaxID=3365669 RepID=UPI0037D635C5
MHPDMDSAKSPKRSARGHRRGSRWLNTKFLTLFLAVATLLGGAALVAPQFQEKASAIDDDKDIGWDMSGGTSAYNAMIEAVRKRATERASGQGSPTLREGILRTNPANRDLFSIDVTNRNIGQSPTTPAGFRILMRASDLFVVGWLVATPQGQEQVFFFRDDDTGYRGQTGNATPNAVSFNGSYTEIERAAGPGRGRVGVNANPGTWEEAYRNMIATAAGESDEQTVARAMLMFIPAIAEGARFDPIQTSFAPTFQGSNSHVVTPAEGKLMTDWGKASKQALDSLNTGSAIDFTIDDPQTPEVDFRATTIQAMATILAICLLSE